MVRWEGALLPRLTSPLPSLSEPCDVVFSKGTPCSSASRAPARGGVYLVETQALHVVRQAEETHDPGVPSVHQVELLVWNLSLLHSLSIG